MSELQEIKLPSNTVVTRAFSSSLTDGDTKCEWMNEKGERIGEKCARPTFGGAKYCAAHTTVDLKRKKLAKRETVQIREVELPLDDINEEDEEDFEYSSEERQSLVKQPEFKSVTDDEILSILKVVVTILAHIRLK